MDKGRVIKEISKEELDIECSRCTVIRTKQCEDAVIVLENELDLFDYKIIDDKEIRIQTIKNTFIVQRVEINHLTQQLVDIRQKESNKKLHTEWGLVSSNLIEQINNGLY